MALALIVEDDADQAQMAAEFLRHRQLEPVTALDGRSGLDQAEARRPDLVLLDLMLPDIDGFEVCRRLRTLPFGPRLPIVMVTALHGDAQRQLGFRVGANAYVTKPYGPADLYRAIDLAFSWRNDLEHARLRGEIQIELDSSPEFLQDVNDFLVGLYRSTPLTTSQIQHLQQAVLELGQNAVEWGNKRRVELQVQLRYRIFDDRVEIVIRDEGDGFDLEDLAHAARPDDPLFHMEIRRDMGLREGGFGLMISRGMVDELRYNETGNEVTLTKHFPTEAIPERPGSED